MDEKQKTSSNSSSTIKKRVRIAFGIIFVVLVVIVVVYFVTRQNGNSGSISSFPLAVSQLSSNANANGAISFSKRSNNGANTAYSLVDIPRSNGTTAWGMVDGLKLSLKGIRIASNFGQRRDYLINWANSGSSSKSIEIGASITTVPVEGNADVSSLNLGTDYLGVDLVTAAPFQVKAFCITATRLVYTTRTGVVSINANASTIASSLPSDYDYLPIASPPTWNDGNIYYNQFAPFKLSTNMTNLILQIDNSYSFQCWDGSTSLNPLFSNDLSASMYFMNLALLVKLGSSSASNSVDDTVTPESYIVSSRLSALSNSSQFDFNTAYVVTLNFNNADGSIFSANLANPTVNSFNSGQALLLGPANFQSIGSGSSKSFNMTDGAQYGKEYRNIKDRIITGFTRPSNTSTIVVTTMSDGPECGLNLIDYSGGPTAVRTCLGNNVVIPIYWRRIVRG